MSNSKRKWWNNVEEVQVPIPIRFFKPWFIMSIWSFYKPGFGKIWWNVYIIQEANPTKSLSINIPNTKENWEQKGNKRKKKNKRASGLQVVFKWGEKKRGGTSLSEWMPKFTAQSDKNEAITILVPKGETRGKMTGHFYRNGGSITHLRGYLGLPSLPSNICSHNMSS